MTYKDAKSNIWYVMKNAIFLFVHFFVGTLHENHKIQIIPYYCLKHEMPVVNTREKEN